MNVQKLRLAVYAADRDALQDALLGVVKVIEGWHRKAAADFADTTLSGSAQKAEQVAGIVAACLETDPSWEEAVADLEAGTPVQLVNTGLDAWIRTQYAQMPRCAPQEDQGFIDGFLSCLEEIAHHLGMVLPEENHES